MSWNQFEYSTADGRPVTLYEFIRGDVVYYRYTNADRDITFAGQTWTQTAISDSGLSAGSGNNLDITAPVENAVVQLFRGIPPSSPLRIRIHRLHIDDKAAEFRTVWVGTVKEVKREAIDRARLITSSLASTFNQAGLRLTWGRACPYALYDANCKVNQQHFAVGVIILALDGAGVTLNLPSGLAADHFSGGYIEWVFEGVTERRGLKAQNGNQVGLLGGTVGLSVGLAVRLYPGCNRTINTCADKFGNHLNYGGTPHMPGKSPFTIIKLF
jgi:uncharacterized phage protein (TIGR02218 family)